MYRCNELKYGYNALNYVNNESKYTYNELKYAGNSLLITYNSSKHAYNDLKNACNELKYGHNDSKYAYNETVNYIGKVESTCYQSNNLSLYQNPDENFWLTAKSQQPFLHPLTFNL
jgi:hypothetical protein